MPATAPHCERWRAISRRASDNWPTRTAASAARPAGLMMPRSIMASCASVFTSGAVTAESLSSQASVRSEKQDCSSGASEGCRPNGFGARPSTDAFNGRQTGCRDFENAQMKAVFRKRGGVVGQVRMAGRELAVLDGEIVAAVDAEPAAAAKLLIDAQAAAGRVGNIGGAALDAISARHAVRSARRRQIFAARIHRRSAAAAPARVRR